MHLVLALIGVCLWLCLLCGSLLLIGLARLGHWLWPDADMGDCWTYALPRWAKHGGALQISTHRLGPLPIPRATWVRPDGATERAEPVERALTLREAMFGLKVIYFRFRVLVRGRRVVEGDGP